jgi:haloalkane dehalogenase
MTGAKPYGQLQYKQIRGKRMAYIDEGVGNSIVFAHGNPTSSYLWRNVMPHLEGLGRLVACDLIGMGASDKLGPSGPDRYHNAEQRDFLFELWDALDLGDRVVLVLHDWGSGSRRDVPAGRGRRQDHAVPGRCSGLLESG